MSEEQAHVSMDTYQRLKLSEMTDSGCMHLLEAVVARASIDFLRGRIYELRHPGAWSRMRDDAEKFFASRWFGAITGLDGQDILKGLYERAARMVRHK